MLWTSVIFAPAGPIAEYWNLCDYWHPPYLVDIAIGEWHFGLEDYFFTFAAAGISSTIFESVAVRRGFAELPRISFKIILWMIIWGIIGLALMAFLASGLRLNSTHALTLAIVISAVLMLCTRRDIFPLIVPVAAIFGFLVWLYYVFFLVPLFPGVIAALWNLQGTWGILLAGVPIEEPIWAFATALFAGPVFRVCSSMSWPKINRPT